MEVLIVSIYKEIVMEIIKNSDVAINQALVEIEDESNKYLAGAIDLIFKKIRKYTSTTDKKKNKAILNDWQSNFDKKQESATMKSLLEDLIVLHKKIDKEGEYSERLTVMLRHLICQIQHIDFLIKIGDSDIYKNNPGEGILQTNNLTVREKWDALLNLPNKRNNPAETNGPNNLTEDLLDKINFSKDLSILYVTGGDINPVGHAILKLGNNGYIHINTLCSYPQYIKDDRHFAAYMRAQGGRVFNVQALMISNPQEARKVLQQFAQNIWLWEMTHNNCLTFVHKIAIAGGVTYQELGYKDDDIHSQPKLPSNFVKAGSGSCLLKGVAVTETYQHEFRKIELKIKKYFEQDDNYSKANLSDIVTYYAILRRNKSNKLDALRCVAICFQLNLTKRYRLAEAATSVCTMPRTIADNANAFFSAVRMASRPHVKEGIKRSISSEQPFSSS